MFTKTLLPDTFRAIKLVSNSKICNDAYLAGGTALALQIGHRISIDLDFFTPIKFDEQIFLSKAREITNFLDENTARGTVWGKINDTKFSLFEYIYPILKPFTVFEGVNLASLEDIAAMKIDTLVSRGTKRDFIDIFFLSKHISIDKMLEFYNKKYSNLDENLYHISRSFSYFDDAETEPMPNMIIDADWKKIKKFFVSEAVRIMKI